MNTYNHTAHNEGVTDNPHNLISCHQNDNNSRNKNDHHPNSTNNPCSLLSMDIIGIQNLTKLNLQNLLKPVIEMTPNTKLQPAFSIHHNGKPLTTCGVNEREANHIINHLEIVGSRQDIFTTEYIGSDTVKPVFNPNDLYCVYRYDKPIYTHQSKSLLTDNAEYTPRPSYLDKATAYKVAEHLEALTDEIKHTRDGKTGSTYSVVLVGGAN